MTETEGGPPPPAAEPVADAPAVDAIDADGLPAFRAGPQDFSVEARGKFTNKDISGYVPSPESDQLKVKLTQFEGPLDLLLHLLDNHAVNILDIPIKTIVMEYMRVLDDMRDLNLDIAGEFLVMAAQLAHIKSKMLLPKEERPKDDEPEMDPREALARRLLEYQRFKDVAQKLDAMPQMGRDVFARPIVPILFDGPIGALPEDIYTQMCIRDRPWARGQRQHQPGGAHRPV